MSPSARLGERTELVAIDGVRACALEFTVVHKCSVLRQGLTRSPVDAAASAATAAGVPIRPTMGQRAHYGTAGLANSSHER
jgi:hypothetical protein